MLSLASISTVMGHLAGARVWDGTGPGPAHPGDVELPLGLGCELGTATAPGKAAELLCQPVPTATVLWPSMSQGQKGCLELGHSGCGLLWFADVVQVLGVQSRH